MAAPDLVNISGLIDDAECFAFVRQQRWPEGVFCPGCVSSAVIRDGCDDMQPLHRHGAGDASPVAARVGSVPPNSGPDPVKAWELHPVCATQ